MCRFFCRGSLYWKSVLSMKSPLDGWLICYRRSRTSAALHKAHDTTKDPGLG